MDPIHFLYAYMGLGILFVIVEHFSYDWSVMDEMDPKLVALNILHQVIHYSRLLIVWPWYIAEDMLILLGNYFLGEPDDSEDVDEEDGEDGK